MKEFKYKGVMAVPKLDRIVLNIGMGEAITNPKLLDVASEELGAITGQKPIKTSKQGQFQIIDVVEMMRPLYAATAAS